MSEKTDEKCYKSTPAKDLEDRITNPNIPKSEAEWWAKGEIERLRGRLALIAPELDKARLYDALFPLVNRIATVSYHQINGDDGPLTTREIWEWQAEAERILYGEVGGYLRMQGRLE